MKAFTVISWLKGLQHSLNVASMYQDLARARKSSCWSVAKTRCLWHQTLGSERRNSDEIWSVASSNSKSCGSLGLSLWQQWLAALAMISGLGKLVTGCRQGLLTGHLQRWLTLVWRHLRLLCWPWLWKWSLRLTLHVRSKLIYTVTRFYDAGSTWVDL